MRLWQIESHQSQQCHYQRVHQVMWLSKRQQNQSLESYATIIQILIARGISKYGSKTALANALKVSRSTIYHWQTKTNQPTKRHLRRLQRCIIIDISQ